MIRLRRGIEEVYKTIGYQKKEDEAEYIYSPYLLFLDVPEGKVIYNTLTREVVLSQDTEEERDYLISRWYMLPEWFQPKALVKMFWQSYDATHPRRRYGPIQLYTILPTTKCNAHCPYCFECRQKKRSMNTKTAKDTVEFIKKHSAQRFHIKWFGGEPLCNTKAMDIIANSLSEKDWASSIITNGYLIDKYADKLKLWRLKWAQITFDGTEDTYNRVKNIKGAESAFLNVLNNIDILLENDVDVTVRLNLSTDNADELSELIDLLKERFGKSIHINVAALYEGEGETPLSLSDEQKKSVLSEQMKLYRKLFDDGLYSPAFPGLKRTHCMADNGRSCVILPDGNLSLCEHHTDDEIYSNIYGAENNKEILLSWQKRTPETEECSFCPLYPQCILLKNCPVEKCDRELKEFKAKLAMERLYKNKK